MSEPEADPGGGGYNRLERAFTAFVGYEGGDDPAQREAWLAKHESVRDLLEPMLEGAPAVDAPAEISGMAAGEQLDDYRLVRELGRGGMGVVWEAVQLSLSRSVALKVLPEAFAWSARAIARFRREASVMARLDHPGLVRVFAVGQDAERLWFAMDLIDGASVAEAIGEGLFEGSDGRRHAVEVGAQVAEALDHAHRSGVLHRDVKPGNVMLRSDGVAMLTDFGLAREESLPTLTLTGALAGTALYVAPEQVAGGEVTPASDVFSLGVTLYEMLASRSPFDAPSMHEVLRRVQVQDPAPLSRVVPGVSRDLEAVVHKAIEKNPAQRYASAAEFGADLRAVLAGAPVAARSVSRWGRVVRAARREPAKASMVIGLAVTVLLAAGMAGYLLANRTTIEAGIQSIEQREIDAEFATASAALARFDGEVAAPILARLRARGQLSVFNLIAEVIALVQAGEQDSATALIAEHETLLAPSGVGPRLAAFVRDEVEPLDPAAIVELPDSNDALVLEGLIAYEQASAHDLPGAAEFAHACWNEVVARAPKPRMLDHLVRSMAAGLCKDRVKIFAAVASLDSHWPGEPAAQIAGGFALSFVDPARAQERYAKVVAAGGATPRTYFEFAQCWIHLRRYERAEEILREGLAHEPRDNQLLLGLGITVYKAGRAAEGEGVFERFFELYPHDANGLYQLARLRVAAGRTEQAIPLLERAAEVMPQSFSIARELGIALREVDRDADAIPHLRRALEMQPDSYELLSWLAPAVDSVGDRAGCLELLERATVANPGSAWAFRNLGELLQETEPKRALAAARRLVALEPDKASAHDLLGRVLCANQRFGEAESWFRDALRLDAKHLSTFEARTLRSVGADGRRAAATVAQRRTAEIYAKLALEVEPACAWATAALTGLDAQR